MLMQRERLDWICLKKLGLSQNLPEPDLSYWREFLDKIKYPKASVTIGLIGKYVELQDAYKSILESFVHAGSVNECKVNVVNVHSEHLTFDNAHEKLGHLDGLLVAPGFGLRGIEGKIIAIQYARETGLPFFGICLGMQMAVIEFARNVLGIKDAHSTEMAPETPHPVIDMMEEQKKITKLGGTMRLGSYPCSLEANTLAYGIYGTDTVNERHRHRWEFNSTYLEDFTKAGMVMSGINPDTGLVEIIELPGHPFFIGVQFHPELKSTVEKPAPLFVHFIKAALKACEKKGNNKSK